MITVTVKYEDHDGNVHVERVTGYDKVNALSKLKHPAKEIYFTYRKPKAELNINNLLRVQQDNQEFEDDIQSMSADMLEAKYFHDACGDR